MSPALLSSAILLLALVLFATEKARHDLVAVTALLACLVLGLVAPREAFSGFGDPAVVTVAAVLVIGRAIELTGAATVLTERLVPARAPFAAQLGALLLAGAALSAFMNNIAALAITMPAAIAVCRRSGRPPSAALMPLSFATILGGMTTLIGTPANLILSSVRETSLGQPFGFFDMTMAGTSVAIAGLVYLALFGWRLVPHRRKDEKLAEEATLFVFELCVPRSSDFARQPLSIVQDKLKDSRAQCIALIRQHRAMSALPDIRVLPNDRLLVSAEEDPWTIAKLSGLDYAVPASTARNAATARVVVAHGSPLIGHPYDIVEVMSEGEIRAVAMGTRAAGERKPLRMLDIQAGDQIVLNGPADSLAQLVRYGRLLEVGRHDVAPAASTRAVIVGIIYATAVGLSVTMGLSTALTFVAAAALLAALRLVPTEDIYRSIDWPAIVLLGAMIPVGKAFETSGAAGMVAGALSHVLSHAPLAVALGVMAAATLLLSIFLNNVATAIIMGPVAISVAKALHADPDAFLIAVLIGASSDFLTPIGHQNNLLVMGPGGYRFLDYARVGGILSIIVIGIAAFVLANSYA